MPLDADGFLRRECPSCLREFKWFTDGDSEPAEEYYCPYCGVLAETSAWNTRAQLEYVKGVAASKVLDPMLKKWERSFRSSSRGGLSIKVNRRSSPKPRPPLAVDDMSKAIPTCHPSETLKVLDDWTGSLHCLVCSDSFEK